MNFLLIFDITRTHLFSRIKQTLIAALGVTFGIGTFITLVSFMTGLNNLLDGLVLNRTPDIQIYNEIKPSKSQPVDLYHEFKNSFNVIHSVKPKEAQIRIHNAIPMINEFKQDARVKGLTAQANARVFYLAGSNRLNGNISGININEEIALFNFSDYVTKGEVTAIDNPGNNILIGAGIAEKLSLDVGDKVQVMGVNGAVFSLKIVGIYQSGVAEVDNVQSFTNIKTAQQILGEGKNFISNIHLRLHKVEDALPFSQQIEQLYAVTALDIKTANAQFETGTTIRNMITYSVSITLLIVAGFGIYNILNMFIYEKMNDIAILKATGFTGQDVKWMFIGQALLIGITGGVFGLLIGYGLTVVIDQIPFETPSLPTIKTFPVTYNPLYYIIGISFAIVSTFFAGYLPARKAEKIDPVEIIRGQ